MAGATTRSQGKIFRGFFQEMAKLMRIYLALSLSLSCIACSFAAQGAESQTAKRCAVNQHETASKIFADFDGHGWREYQNLKSVPEIQLNSGSAARLWLGGAGSYLVWVEEPGEDFATYTDYCFDRTGHLLELRYELRTAWGWGYREEGPFANGKLKPDVSEFFNTKTDKPIKRPEQAADVPDALKPRIYLSASQLPFFKLLSK
jgi:hypothetical protein